MPKEGLAERDNPHRMGALKLGPPVRGPGVAGVPRRRVYDLRHTFASNALAAGISLYELSRYMGASVRVLEMHYAHLVPDAEDAARVKLDARAAAL
jgi:integrase